MWAGAVRIFRVPLVPALSQINKTPAANSYSKIKGDFSVAWEHFLMEPLALAL